VARDIYFAQVAHALWMDMSGSLPWRLGEWTDNELGYLLSSRPMFLAERLSPDDTLYNGVLATSKSVPLLLWDTFVKERSRGCGSVVGLSALPVAALTPL